MTLQYILLTLGCIASLITVLANALFTIGVLVNRIAESLDDYSGNVKTITQRVEALFLTSSTSTELVE